MGIPEKIIRGMIEKGWVCYSDHAQQRMGERKIPRQLVDHALLNGEIIEIQDFPDQDIKVVFQSGTEDFYVIVAAKYPQAVVVTVCNFMEEVWEQLGTVRKRRKKE